MSSASSSVAQLSSQHPIIQSQKIQVSLDERGELIKVYCKNIFVGIALLEKNKEGLHLSEQTKESIKVLTSSTEAEVYNAFKVVESLSQEHRSAAINQKLYAITLFIEQINANPRLKAHITKCDVANLVDQIEKLESMNIPKDVKHRLIACRNIIAAFKMDKVLLSHLKDNNAFNIRYYNEGIRDGGKKLERVQAILEKAEEGALVDQIEDLHRCGKLVKEENMKLSDLKHGDVVCFEKTPGQKYGENAIAFAVVDLIGESPALHVQNGEKSSVFIPKRPNMSFTRVSPAGV